MDVYIGNDIVHSLGLSDLQIYYCGVCQHLRTHLVSVNICTYESKKTFPL